MTPSLWMLVLMLGTLATCVAAARLLPRTPWGLALPLLWSLLTWPWLLRTQYGATWLLALASVVLFGVLAPACIWLKARLRK